MAIIKDVYWKRYYLFLKPKLYIIFAWNTFAIENKHYVIDKRWSEKLMVKGDHYKLYDNY